MIKYLYGLCVLPLCVITLIIDNRSKKYKKSMYNYLLSGSLLLLIGNTLGAYIKDYIPSTHIKDYIPEMCGLFTYTSIYLYVIKSHIIDKIKYIGRIYNNQVINGKIDHIDIGTETIIHCSFCDNLVKLPNWPNVIEVWCSNCPKLTFLPNWPNVKAVYCYNCPKITFLPNWRNIRLVSCEHCPELKELPNWLNIEDIYTSLTKIKYYPKLKYLNGINISEKYHLKYIFDQHIKLDKSKNVILNRDILYLLLNEYIY